MSFHKQEISEIIDHLNTNQVDGLDLSVISSRINVYGNNMLEENSKVI